MNIYFELFNSEEDVLNEFNITKEQLHNYNILFAYYNCENYEGEAFVLLRDPDTNKLYEVNGGHCSCFGLEDQWEMEETTLDALNKRDYPFFNEVVKAHITKDLLMKNVFLENKKESSAKLM